MLFRDGVAHEYHGPRSFNDMVGFVEKAAAPAVHELKSVEEAREFMDSHYLNFVGCFGDADAKAKEAYKSAAKSLYLRINKAHFGVVPATFKDALQISKVSTVTVHSPDFVPVEHKIDSSASADDIRLWLLRHALPALDDITEENIMLYYEANLPVVWLVMQSPSDTTLEWVRDLAIQYSESLKFVWLDK